MDGRAYKLIVRNLQEVVGDDELRRQSVSPDEHLSVYWGTATTGRPHVAYFVPIIKLADFLKAGCKVIVLFADLHGYLDNMKAPWSLLRLRTRYYEAVVKGMLQSINVPLDRLTFFRGADFELTEAYSSDIYRLLAVTSVHDARKAGAEVVKQVSNPLVSGLLYPLLQVNDEVHLGVRAQFGGVDQRKIFMLAEKYLPHIGQKKRIHLMNPMVPGLTGGKMSASEVDSKIDLLDSRETVERKLTHALCTPGQSAEGGNGILAFLKYVVFPLTSEEKGLTVAGHTEAYRQFSDLETDFLAGRLSAEALKRTVSDCLNERLDVIRTQFAESPQLTDLTQRAYPNSEADGPGVGSLDSELADVSIGPGQTTQPGKEPLVRISQRLDEVAKRLGPVRDRKAVIRTIQEEFSGLDASGPILDGNRIRLVWSVTPLGLPHLGYSLPMRSLAKLSRLDGVLIVILVNNVAAHLRGAIPWDLVVPRGEFYRTLLTGLFKAVGGRSEQMTCVLGSEYQLGGDFMLEFYHLVSLVPEADCLAAVTESSPQSVGPLSTPEELGDEGDLAAPTGTVAGRFVLGQLLLPCLDLIDSLYLRADLRLAGESACRWRKGFEQRMIGRFLGQSHTPLACLSHALLPSLLTSSDDPPSVAPMQQCLPLASASTCTSPELSTEDACLPLVDLVSSAGPAGILPGVKRRLKKAFCRPGLVEVNPVLDVYRHVLLPELASTDSLVIPRSDKNGGPLHVETAEASLQSRWTGLCSLFSEGTLHPGDLKPAVELGLCGPGSLAERLAACLPPWNKLVLELEAAFPSAGKQKQKTTAAASKANKKSGVVGENNASTPATVPPPQSINNEGGDKQEADDMDPNRLDIRVGRIISVNPHPNSDKFYVEQVDFGIEFGTRTVCSSLVEHVPPNQLESFIGAFVVNLKPVSMRGVLTQAMLLCISSPSADSPAQVKTRPIRVPESLLPGTRLVFHPPSDKVGDAFTPRKPELEVGLKTKLLGRLSADLTVSPGADRCVSWHHWRLGTESREDGKNSCWVTVDANNGV